MNTKINFEPNTEEQKELINLLQGKNFDKVQNLLNKYGSKVSASSILSYYQGFIYSKKNNLDKSIEFYQNSLKINPNYIEAANNIGLIYLQRKEYDLAQEFFSKTIKIDENFFHGYFNLGIVFLEKNNFVKSELNFLKCINFNKNFYEAYNGLGNLYLKFRKFNDAKKAYESVLKITPDSAEAVCNLGIVFLELKQYKESLDLFSNALDLDKNCLRAHSNMSAALYGLQKIDQSIISAKKALKINPDNLPALQNLANSLEAKGKKEESEKIYQKILLLNINNGAMFKSYAQFLPLMSSESIVKEVEKNYQDNKTDGVDRVYQAFGLFYIYDREKNYKTAYQYLKEGNKLYDKMFPHDFSNDLRIFNAAISNFKKVLFQTLGDGGSSDPSPIFIVGMPRSGSTLVEQILDSHSLVSGMGEIPILNRVLSENNLKYSELIHLSKTKRLDLGNQYINTRNQLFSENGSYIVDKVPQNFLFIGIIKLILPNAKIINTVRNPKDNCFSIYSQAFTDGQPYSYNLKNIFNYYKEYKKLMSHFKTVIPDFVYDLEYEELVKNKETSIRKLLEFCNLDFESNCINFHKNKRNVTTPSSSQVRKKIFSTSIEKYKNYPEYEEKASQNF